MISQCFKTLAFGTAAIAMLGTLTLAPDGAHAKRRGTTVIEQSYEVPGPLKGFSGGVGGYHCDYQRIPNRVCTIGLDGQERCKIVSWTLKQFCY